MTKKFEEKITEDEILEFFGEDEPSEIARYLASNMNLLANGHYSIEEFIELHKPEPEEDDEEFFE